MELHSQPSAQRVHIGFFGRRNAGKSSLVNAVTGQALSIVSPDRAPPQTRCKSHGTPALGPVVIMDTPGIDDDGEWRSARGTQPPGAGQNRCGGAGAGRGNWETAEDKALLSLVQARGIPYVIALNKADLQPERPPIPKEALWVSALTGEGIDALKERIALLGQPAETPRRLVGDLLSRGDRVVLVTPIDASAPKVRLILPQQQTIRDILDAGAIPLLARPEELPIAMSVLVAPPRLVITDSQVFSQVHQLLPEGQPLTSFSILLRALKEALLRRRRGCQADSLQDGDTMLISEGVPTTASAMTSAR